MYSPLAGDAVLAIAIRTVTAPAPLFTMVTVTTANVDAGTVYSVVFVVAATSAMPNLPVAMCSSPLLYLS
jgi:hypothetical protein